jgi:hypothetical protein
MSLANFASMNNQTAASTTVVPRNFRAPVRARILALAMLLGTAAAGSGLVAGVVQSASAASTASSYRRLQTLCCDVLAPKAMTFRENEGYSVSELPSGLEMTVYQTSATSARKAVLERIAELDALETFKKSSGLSSSSSGYLDSGDSGALIYYIRATYSGSCGSVGVMELVYPKAKKKQFDAAVNTITKSFKVYDCG